MPNMRKIVTLLVVAGLTAGGAGCSSEKPSQPKAAGPADDSIKRAPVGGGKAGAPSQTEALGAK